ncbi:ribbon-helix-helix domain-containing protein [Pyrococcus kukulkanii]|uniref:ribbon-helix-helix domain-containing protein n=1 Tax=Pyrococcus kukulkanii TaxID=1609559 RepID=UPI0008309D8D|nr:ribbon-helix-helix domain-containing protein [Pyrococcus kukulkanii]
MEATEKITVRFPKGLVREMDRLIQEGEFSSRSELIKEAVRLFLLYYRSPEELWEIYKIIATKRKIPSEKEIERILEEVDEEWKRSRQS